jgi:cytochrome P450
MTPAEGAIIDGYKIPGGTIVGVNPWVIHRNTEIYGQDVDVFRPERWLDGPEAKVDEMKRNLFSVSFQCPRECMMIRLKSVLVRRWPSHVHREEYCYDPDP